MMKARFRPLSSIDARLVRASLLLGLVSAVAACGDDGGGDDPVADAGSDVVDATGDVPGDTDAGSDAMDATGDGSGIDAVADVEEDTTPIGPLSCAGTGGGTFSPGESLTLEAAVDGGAVPIYFDFVGREWASEAELALSCEDVSIVPEGFVALSPAFTLSAPLDRFSRRYFVTAPFDRGAFPENARPSAIRIFWRGPNSTVARQPIVVNLQENMARGTVRFETELVGTFQIGVSEEAGTTFEREWKFRAVTGISMGASGASTLGMRNPDEFDIIGPLGGPTDWTYLAHYIHAGGMGGFNPAPTFGPADNSASATEEYEHPQSFDNWYFPTGEGTGGSFNRSDYIQIFLDLMLTFGNMVTYRPDSPYAAPGLPLDQLLIPDGDRCDFNAECSTNAGVFTIESGYYDDEYNPDGTYPVISFCDGRGSDDRSIPFDRACDISPRDGNPDEPNEGLYDDPCGQDRPVDITFAVDVNSNGMRDPGEPIIRNFFEPYGDFGTDGVLSADEDGFDALLNPDPVGDDYDYVSNPNGTEGNWLYDAGETYLDYGLDGVEGSPQIDEGGYDFGEGNGEFDYNPNLERLLFEINPRSRFVNLPAEARDNITWWVDAGVRDLFNFAVGANSLMGAVQSVGENVRVYDEFYPLEDLLPEDADDYNFTNVDYENLGEHVYLRYGSLDAGEEDICYGDGKHVGTPLQIVNRLVTMLGFVTNRFPDGELTPLTPPYTVPNGTYFAPSEITGGIMRYSVALPPGYEITQCSDLIDNDDDGLNDGEDPDCPSADVTSEGGDTTVTRCTDGIDNDADRKVDAEDPDCADGDGSSEQPLGSPLRDATFPVVYILHGYGQTPDDLQATAVPFASFMAQGRWPKVILVFPDGYCGDIDVRACSDGIDNDGDEQIDGADGNCGPSGGRSESTDERVAYCNDGIDNDIDGLTDSEDGGCLSDAWETEGNCIRGNFYADHQSYLDGQPGGPEYEQMFLELVDFIDDNYRTRDPEIFDEIRD